MIMLLSIIGIVSTSAFAVRATEVFSSPVNVGITQVLKDTNKISCIEDTKFTECVDGTVRALAPYANIDSIWPDFTQADIINVANGQTVTIDAGDYSSINVNDGGILYMNPGTYTIKEYVVKGQVLPGDKNGTDLEGTVTLIVKSKLNLIGSENNCKRVGNNKYEPYQHPNRYVFYTEDKTPIVEDSCMSGYMYFKHDLKDAEMDLWGAISAETITEKRGAKINIYTDLEHVIFTNFDGFLEIGPKVAAGWHMLKAPAEINATNNVKISCFFGDDLNTSTYGTEWIVYQRDYDEVTHQSYYTALTLDTPLEKSRGYWLGLKKNAEVKALGLDPVVWDETMAGCTSPHGCTRYTLQSCSVGDTDPYLYDLVGSVGSRKSDWKDYRVEVDNNGIVMTPSEANAANIISNQIWKYSPSTTGTYVTADDSGLVDSTIDYFEGFWAEVNCTNSVGKTIDLIVPNRM